MLMALELLITQVKSVFYAEFVVAYSELQTLTAKEKLETTFKLFDKDGNGTISKPEL